MGGRDGDEASLLRDANKALKRLLIPCLCTVKDFSTRGALRVGRVDEESGRVSCLFDEISSFRLLRYSGSLSESDCTAMMKKAIQN